MQKEDEELAEMEEQLAVDEQALTEEVFTLDAKLIKKKAEVEPKAAKDWIRFELIMLKEITC